MKTLLIALTLMSGLTGKMAKADSYKDEQRALIAYMLVEPGTQGKFLREAKEVIIKSRREPGNLTYQLHQSSTNSQLFVFYELFASQEDLTYHRNAPHTVEFLKKTRPYTLKFTLEEFQPREGR